MFFYEEELTTSEMFDLASQALGEDFKGSAIKVRGWNPKFVNWQLNGTAQLSDDEVVMRAKSPEYSRSRTWYEYMHSLYVRGDNTVEKARELGALIGNELYPDQELQSAAEWLKEEYRLSA